MTAETAQAAAGHDSPAVEGIAAAAYEIPSDQPEADGTLAWSSTTMIVAHVAAAVPNLRHLEYFHDHARIESMLFDGALDPRGGMLRPDTSRPGLGLALRHADAAPFRTA
jgi:hypothetical protein